MEEIKKPKATVADFEKREKLTDKLNENWSDDLNSEWLDMMNSLDWDTEIIYDGDKCGLMNWRGEILLPPVFEGFGLSTGTAGKYIEMYKGKWISAMKDGKWGVVVADGAGTWIVDPVYDHVGYPSNLTHVKKDGRWGVLNITEGKFLIEPVCDSVDEYNGSLFCNGIGFYKKDGKYGVIGGWGEYTPAIFDDYEGAPEGAVKVMSGGEWGYADKDGNFTTDEDKAYYYFSE